MNSYSSGFFLSDATDSRIQIHLPDVQKHYRNSVAQMVPLDLDLSRKAAG